MKKDVTVDNYKLWLVVLVCLALVIVPCILISHCLNNCPNYVGYSVGLLPIVSMMGVVAFTRKPGGIFEKLVYIKYNKKYPFIYRFDDEPKRYRWKKATDVESLIESGDVLLRRHDDYIDGLVLLQNSYYSHVGLAEKDELTGKVYVHHALGKPGVTKEPYEKFAKCDDIAVLRFNGGKGLSEYLKKFSDSKFYKTNMASKKLEKYTRFIEVYAPKMSGNNQRTFEMTNVRNIVDDTDEKIMFNGEKAGVVELRLFDKYKESIDNGNFTPPTKEEYIPLVLTLAKGSAGVPYDYNFNFQNFKSMSCVEFVWFCYKSLFPIHQVKRRVYTFFDFIKTFVMVPDNFLASKAFDLVYCSMDGIGTNKYKLLHYIKSRHVKFWNVIARLVVLQVIIFISIYVIWISI
jgi:hypothetical protein